MKVSQLIGSTLRQVEGHTPGMTFLLRAGYLRKPMADSTVLLTLGQKAVAKIAAGLTGIPELKDATRIQLPVLFTEDYWAKAGISKTIPQNPCSLFVHLISSEISSYRQLPKIAWQIRPTSPSGSGNILDVWVVSENRDLLGMKFQALVNEFFRVINKWRLFMEQVIADPGAGAESAVIYLYPFDFGKTLCLVDNRIYHEPSVARIEKEDNTSETPLPVEKVYTPATASIRELADFLGVPASRTSKVVFFMGKSVWYKQPQLIIAVIRGDRDVNETAICNTVNAVSLRPATEAEIAAVGCVAGFASPVGIRRENVIVIADDEIAKSPNLVAGANEKDFHLKNVCYNRDYTADYVTNIALAEAGNPGSDGIPLVEKRGITMGKVVDAGPNYSELLNAGFMSEAGKPEPFYIGHFQWDLEAILSAMAEANHDENGLVWPEEISPFDIALVSLDDGIETKEVAAMLYEKLQAAGKSVLFDDRDKKVAGPGVKFTDADLQGFPLRITVSKRALAEGGVEVKRRKEEEKKIVKIEDLLTPPPTTA